MESNADHLHPPVTSLAEPPAPLVRAGRISAGLGSLQVRQKMGLIAGAFTLPLTVMLLLLVSEQQKGINVARAEIRGSNALKPLDALMTNIERHGDVTMRLRVGDTTADAELDKTAAQVNSDIKTLSALAQAHPELKLGASVQQFQQLWGAFQDGSSGDIDSEIKVWGETVPLKVAELVQLVANSSGLTLDPQLDTHFTQDALVSKLPQLRSTLAQIRMTVGGGGGTRPEAWSLETRERVRVLISQAGNALKGTLASVNFAAQARPSLQRSLGAGAEDFAGKVDAFLQAATSLVGHPSLTKEDIAQVSALGAEIAASSQALTGTAQGELDHMLSDRLLAYNRSRLTSLLGVGLALLATLWLLFTIARAITRPLRELTRAANALGAGDLSTHVDVRGSDEIALVGRTFNGAVAQLREVDRKNALEREAAADLQRNVGAFLDVAMNVAGGDLTVRGRVTADAIGSVVDATNLALDEISRLLTEVQRVAVQVQGRADELSSTSGVLTGAAREQAEQAGHMKARALQFTQVFRDTAEQTLETARSAEQTLETARAGQNAVQETGEGLEELRAEMQDISGSMRDLLARSEEIAQIAETITSFASQTTLLALGASLEAAGAGEAGRRFMIVADGVRQLAEESANAAYKVDSITKTVQEQVRLLSLRVENSARTMNAEYEVAARAGRLLRDIEALASRSADTARSIAEATQRQVGEAEQMSQTVATIAASAAQTEQASSSGLQDAQRLDELARELAAQLARFRLSAR